MNTNKNFGLLATIVFAASVFVSPVSAACTLQTLGECDTAGLMSLISGLSSTTTTTTTTTTSPASFGSIPAGFTFTKNLTVGSRGEEVKYVQVFLNSDPETQVSVSGAGSPGNETTYFGNATKNAVKKFQAKYGITPVYGYWGSISRAKANSLLASTPSTPSTPTAGCLPGAAYSSTTGLPCGTSTPTNPTVPVTGSLSVAIASDNPAVSTLISTQAIGDLAHFTFTNGSNAEAKITSIELTRLGVSADGTLRNVYLFNGVTRLTDAGSLSSGKVTFNDPNGLFTIPAGQTVTVAVKADIAANQSGQTVGIALSGVTSSVTLASTLPLNGNIHSIANATLATVTIAAPQPAANVNVDPADGTRIWESAFSINNRNVKFTRLSLKQINSIDAKDIINFKLLIDGVEVATTPALQNGYVIFTFDKVLATGTRNVKVLADIKGGSSRIIQMSVRNNADIDIRDVDYNVPLSPVAGSIPATTGQMTVNQGTTTVTVDNSALPATVANNASGVLLGKWKVKANGENIRVEGLRFTGVGAGTGAGSIASLKNGKVMINGAQYGSTAGLALTAGTLYNVNYTFQAGVETIVEFYADIGEDTTGATVTADSTNNIANGSTLTITFAVPTSANGTKQVSLGTVNVPMSASAAAGVTVADGTSGFTVVRTSTLNDQNLVVPKPATKIASYNVTAGTSEDIYVNNFRIGAVNVGNARFNKDDLADLYVVYTNDGGTAITTTAKNTVDANNDFPISFTLGKGKTVKVEVYSSLQNNNTDTAGNVTAGDSLRTTLIVSGTGASSGVAVANTATNGQLVIAQNAGMVASRDATTAVSSITDDNGSVKTVAYKFEAQNDDYSISRLVFTIADPSVVATASLKDGDTVLATQSGSGVVTFNLATPVTVSANTTKILTVELALSSVGQGAGNTGAIITTNISLTNCLARSTNGALTAPTGTPVSGNGLFVYKAVPTISLVSLPSGTLGTGTQVISKFSVSTNGTGTVGWKKVIFNISKSSHATDAPAITAAELWEVDSNTKIDGVATLYGNTTAGATIATNDAAGTLTFVATSEQQISGQKTYEVRATVTDAVGVVTGEYINTSIPNTLTVYKAPNTYANAAAALDVSATGLAYTDADTDNTVSNADTRRVAVAKYTTADVTKDQTVIGHNAGTAGAEKIVQSYGVPTGFTMTLAEGTTENSVGAATLTVSGVSGLICTPYTGAAFTGAVTVNTTLFSAVHSIDCQGNGMQLRIGNVTLVNDDDAVVSSGTLTIVITRGTDYAVDSVVDDGSTTAVDSDFSLALTNGVAPSFVWTDVSAQSHSETTRDWSGEYLVKNLPTSTQNLTK
ncbi:MAG: peptidoglycan-binding domain-containing protein [Candidatus Paceibacterota bacterium]